MLIRKSKTQFERNVHCICATISKNAYNKITNKRITKHCALLNGLVKTCAHSLICLCPCQRNLTKQ